MDKYRPLRIGIFLYECLRLLLLVIFVLGASPGAIDSGGGFAPGGGFASGGNWPGLNGLPYVVYLSSNALFALIALFVWLKPEEYWNYLNLYMAGKIMALVTFYLWQLFHINEFWGTENLVVNVFLIWGCVIVSLTDMLSLWGARVLKNLFRRSLQDCRLTAGQPGSGGTAESGGN